MADLKTLGTIAIIVGCFAIIYPRFLHPMVLRAFGMQVKPTKEEDPLYPPNMRHGASVPGDRRPPPIPNDPKDIRQHMRPGPHPGMRAAAEMQKQQAQGSGRGMMGIVLPMYAIGICVYLVYTLFKVFNKRGKYSDPYSRSRYETEENEGRVDRLGFPQAMRGTQGEEQTEVQTFLQRKQQQRDLEDLLAKMDEARSVPEDEMRALQKRLEETEAQMTRILQAMQTMQARAGAVVADSENSETGNSAPTEQVETVGASGAGKKDPSAKEEQSSQSSPDTEKSYEMVKNSASDARDASPNSTSSSPSSFEHVEQNHVEEGQKGLAKDTVQEEEEGEREEILSDGKKGGQEEEGESSVRHRKTVPVDEN